MDDKKMEEELANQLTTGELDRIGADEAARKQLLMKTEIRIQAQIDPIVEGTRQYRKIAEEVDERYAQYDRIVEAKATEEKEESDSW